jgi:Domain of unknown function (DUF1737)
MDPANQNETAAQSANMTPMEIITLYKTVRETEAAHLDASVNAAIKEGYQPFGSPYSSGNFLCQALAKTSSNKAP